MYEIGADGAVSGGAASLHSEKTRREDVLQRFWRNWMILPDWAGGLVG